MPSRWRVTIGYGPDDPQPNVTQVFDHEPDIESIKASFGLDELWMGEGPPSVPYLVEMAKLTLDNGGDYV